MVTGTQERRLSTRVAAAHAVIVRDLEGNLLARGRTTDISERGAFALTNSHPVLQAGGEVLVELFVPALVPRRSASRTVTYRCRIARLQPIAQMTGLALDFLVRTP
ncbi:MAG: PilZ domain-containing protein [Planctomycetota bacterium]|nr:PilZ domain-containing protein [Planctomycetota bacterium]